MIVTMYSGCARRRFSRSFMHYSHRIRSIIFNGESTPPRFLVMYRRGASRVVTLGDWCEAES